MSQNSQINHLWSSIRKKAEDLIPPVSYKAFIESLDAVEILDRRIVLKAPTDLAADVIMTKHAEKLREANVRVDVGLSDFKLIVSGSEKYNMDADDDGADLFHSVPLKKEFTFDSYVVGSSNKFVHAAAKSVAEHPGEGLNPLFIYGESGLGKTHLLQAIANHITVHLPKTKVLYTTCENFLNGFIDSMIAGKINQRDKSARFRAYYRNVDVLIIDDIQFLAKKPGVQEEFFHTFNELYSQNKQIVLTSDRPPKEIATLEERLRTRFEGGLIADIQPPDPETKIAILKKKALDKKYPMPDEVLEFLASDSGHDVRTLEGRLTKVIFASKLHEEPISLSLAKKALHEAVVSETEEKEDVTPEVIISAVCTYYKFRKDEVLGKSKKADVVKARQICAYLMCDVLSLPLVSIGNIMGGRDHTTIMYSRNKVEELMKFSDKIAKEVDDIRNIVFKQ